MKRIIVPIFAIPMLLAGCGQRTITSNTSPTKVSWDSIPPNEQQAILKVSYHYGDSQPKVVRVVQTVTEANQKPMYLIFLSGHFHDGDIQSNNLSFSILADGSQTWAVFLNSTPVTVSSGRNPELPSWLSISSNDIRAISIQGWGPGADGNFTIYPAYGTSLSLINTVLDGLSNDKAIKPYTTPMSQGGGEWLELKMQNGTSISLATFPNEPKLPQYIVTLDSALGKPEKSTMISDVSGEVTSVFNEMNKGKLVRQKTH